MSNADRILDVLRAASEPLDEDELSRRSGIYPRQQVNQICRSLEAQGLITRTANAIGKLVNALSGSPQRTCLCGCGESTNSSYLPGHDARHASHVADQLAPDGLSGVESEAISGLLPTDALRTKAQDMADRRRSTVAAATTSLKHEGAADVTPIPEAKLVAGSSLEQRSAERVMMGLLGVRLGADLAPRRLTHSSGARVEVDGASADLRFLVECWAHQGPAKVAQQHKLMNDATKLAWIAKSLPVPPERLILCVSDELAVSHLRGRSWRGAAMPDLGVEIEVVSLPDEVTAMILAAQKRQFR